MVSITINKHVYKPSVQDIMDKYYEMFHGKNRGNKLFQQTRGCSGLGHRWVNWMRLVLSEEE
jgi:hypothetical protein